mmetsp:Transcript_54467/g.167701  ORF Transcript_54467/g.167701 Transcript_54467/m.167701 type:complete len:329 (-) Transcript_54467:647-1633(-)
MASLRSRSSCSLRALRSSTIWKWRCTASRPVSTGACIFSRRSCSRRWRSSSSARCLASYCSWMTSARLLLARTCCARFSDTRNSSSRCALRSRSCSRRSRSSSSRRCRSWSRARAASFARCSAAASSTASFSFSRRRRSLRISRARFFSSSVRSIAAGSTVICRFRGPGDGDRVSCGGAWRIGGCVRGLPSAAAGAGFGGPWQSRWARGELDDVVTVPRSAKYRASPLSRSLETFCRAGVSCSLTSGLGFGDLAFAAAAGLVLLLVRTSWPLLALFSGLAASAGASAAAALLWDSGGCLPSGGGASASFDVDDALDGGSAAVPAGWLS